MDMKNITLLSRLISTIFIVFISAMGLFDYRSGLAQTNEPANYFNVLHIDRSNLPTVEMKLLADNAATGTVDVFENATIEIIEDGETVTVLQDQVVETDLMMAFLVDPRALDEAGASGQPHYLEMVGMTIKLTEDSESVRADDLLALFTAKPNGRVRSLQSWTQDESLLFKTILQQRSEMSLVENELLEDSILYALDEFDKVEDSAIRAKSLLFFSQGLDGGDEASSNALNWLISELQAQQIQVNVAQFVPLRVDATADRSLQRLANETNGHFMLLDSQVKFAEMFEHIKKSHTQRTVSYSSDTLVPQEIGIKFTREDGTTLIQRFNSNGQLIGTEPFTQLANTAAQVPTTADSAQAQSSLDNTNSITIPGTNILLSRIVILASLLLMLILFAILLTLELRSRRPQSQAKPFTQVQGINSQKDAITQQRERDLNYIRSQHAAHTEYVNTRSVTARPFTDQNINTRQVHSMFNDRGPNRLTTVRSISPVKADTISDEPTIPVWVQQNQSGVPSPELLPRPSLSKAQPTIKAQPATAKQESPKLVQPKLVPDEKTGVKDVKVYGAKKPDLGKNSSGLDDAVAILPTAQQADMSLQPNEYISRSIVGYFVRVTNDPRLPLMLPIYQLATDDDGLRQIHIGRNGALNTVVINSKRVSREHAIMIQREDQLYLRDNNSTAGTYLNWRRLGAGDELLVRHNDLIGFGNIHYEFRGSVEDEKTVMDA